MARTHKHAAHYVPQSTGRPDWREVIRTRDEKRELRRSHARNVAPRQQAGVATLRLIVGAGLAICAALAARGVWQAAASALQAVAMHGGA